MSFCFPQASERLPIAFGNNLKAQLSFCFPQAGESLPIAFGSNLEAQLLFCFPQAGESLPIAFGSNLKAQLSFCFPQAGESLPIAFGSNLKGQLSFCFPQAGESLPIAFGSNLKAQLSARTMFALAHRHGDILREGWKNIMDCMLQLFKAKLLPKSMVEVGELNGLASYCKLLHVLTVFFLICPPSSNGEEQAMVFNSFLLFSRA